MSGIRETTNVGVEQDLILRCSSTRLSEEEKDKIYSLLNDSPDWDFLLNQASRNGLLPLASWNLLNSFPDLLPEKVKIRITEHLSNHTRRNLYLTSKLIDIIRELEKTGIPALPFKGATLAQRAYGNIALRDFVDLDILVQPKHFNEAVDRLGEKGFKPIGDTSWTKRRTAGFSRRKDLGLSSEDRSVIIELHWKISGSHFGLPFEIRQLWERLEKIQIGGASLNALSFTDLFVYLCLHGSRHGWEKLAWLCDLRELVESHKASGATINWTEIRDRARLHGCEKVVELAIYLLDSYLDYEIDFPGREKILCEEAFGEIANSIWEKTMTSSATSSEIGDWYFYHLSLKERKQDRLRVHFYYFVWYMRLVFTPNALDKAIFPLPGIFYPLYFILRPFRLLAGYFSVSGKDSDQEN